MIKITGQYNKFKVNNNSNNIHLLHKTTNNKYLHNINNNNNSINNHHHNNNLEVFQQIKITSQLHLHQAKMLIKIITQLHYYRLINNNNLFMGDKVIIFTINLTYKEIRWLLQLILNSNKLIIINNSQLVEQVLNSTDIIITSDLYIL